jgi:hypothetical protein
LNLGLLQQFEKEIQMNPSVESLENQYFLLRESLSNLMAQGATPDQLNQLRTAIAKSRDNYWLAARRIMHDDDPDVKSLVSQLNLVQLSLAATIQHLGDIAKVIDAITKAVNIGSQLAAKAVAL